MTSIADTDHGASKLALSGAEAPAGRNFNLRAYLAGAGATTALIAGAIVVFASLGAYVAFNGLPVGSGNENASQLTISAGEVTATPAAGLLGRAAGAVAATAAAPTPTAPAPGSRQAGSGGPAGPGSPGSGTPTGTGPATPAPTPEVPVTAAPTGGASTAGGGAIGSAVGNVSGATGVPLDGATNAITGPVDEVLDGVDDTLGTPQVGQAAGDAVGGLTGSLLP